MSSIISLLGFSGKQVAIYLGIPTLVAGVLGGFLIIIVFLSLQTFRESSCAFYLTIMSLANIGQLLTGLLSRIMITGFNIDWTQTSLFYCKLRYFIFQTCTLISLTCICLATIDQFFITCSRPRWQQWSSIKVARRLTAVFSFIWSLHGIFYLVFRALVESPLTDKVSCSITNVVFAQYHNYFFALILIGCLPLFITVLFGFLAYYNVRQRTHRALPLVRRELDNQLSAMVFLQVITSFFTISPYVIV
jgi:hypothetical protein